MDTVLGVKVITRRVHGQVMTVFTFDVSEACCRLITSANIAQVIVSSKVPNPDYGVVTDRAYWFW